MEIDFYTLHYKFFLFYNMFNKTFYKDSLIVLLYYNAINISVSEEVK